jgi:hypothetical protein
MYSNLLFREVFFLLPYFDKVQKNMKQQNEICLVKYPEFIKKNVCPGDPSPKMNLLWMKNMRGTLFFKIRDQQAETR